MVFFVLLFVCVGVCGVVVIAITIAHYAPCASQ